jgi:hypothetical protein
VRALRARSNLLRRKKIGRAGREIAFVAVHDAMPVVQRVSACWHSRIDVEVFSDEFRASKCGQGVAIDLHFLEPKVDGPMLAIQESARRSKIEVVRRNRFPVRRERSSGPPVLVVKKAQSQLRIGCKG